MFDIHKMDRVMPDVKQWVADIMAAGYDVDYLSDRLIDSLSVTSDGRLLSRGGNNYRAVIVPKVAHMPESTIRGLRVLADRGAQVIFTDDVASAAAGLDIPAEPLRQSGVSMLRRRNECGGHNYFISVLRDTVVDGWVRVASDAVADVMIFDPVTGKRGVAQSRKADAPGYTDVRLQMQPGSSLLLKTFPTAVNAEPWHYVERRGTPMNINSGWSISFPKSDPAIGESFVTDTLTPWTNLPDERAKINSATGRYTVTVNLPDSVKADGWVLDLGDVRESARVTVNGSPAGCVWCVPMSIEIGALLHPGQNEIVVDVTNLQANRIADYERRGVEWRVFKDANIASVTNAKKFSFGDWDTVPSGLNSTVSLTPVYYEK